MTLRNTHDKGPNLHQSLERFAADAKRIAGMEKRGRLTPEQAARQIGELYFELSIAAARNALR